MKKIVALIALVGASIAPVAFAAPSVAVIGSPDVMVIDNPACQEVIYTWNVELAGNAMIYDIEGAGVKVGDTVLGSFNAPVNSGVTNVDASIATPCAPEARYGIYSDNFRVDQNEVEDVTVKAFFTPETAGAFVAEFLGMEVSDKPAKTSGGGGGCLNCHFIDEADEDASLEEEDSEFLGVMIENEEFDAETTAILEFIKLLISLGLIDLS